MAMPVADAVLRKVGRQAGLQQRLAEYMQLALTLAEQAAPELVQSIGADMAAL